jgi:hypothetical protein
MKLKMIIILLALTISSCNEPYYTGKATIVDSLIRGSGSSRWQLVVVTDSKLYFHAVVTEAEFYSGEYNIGDIVSIFCKNKVNYCELVD